VAHLLKQLARLGWECPVCHVRPRGAHGRGGGTWVAVPRFHCFTGMVCFEGTRIACANDRYCRRAGCDCVDNIIDKYLYDLFRIFFVIQVDMMTYFSSVWSTIMIALFALGFIMDIIQHVFKKKLIGFVLQSEERRQRHIRMDSILVSYERKLLWQLLAILPVLALSSYYFLPRLLYIPILIILFCPLILDDYFYRKSFLMAIDKK
jgi:hypothetical protein